MKKLVSAAMFVLAVILMGSMTVAAEPPCSPKAKDVQVISALEKQIAYPDGAAEAKDYVYLERKTLSAKDGCYYGVLTADANPSLRYSSAPALGPALIFVSKVANLESTRWQCVIGGNDATMYYETPNNVDFKKWVIPCGAKGDVQGTECNANVVSNTSGVYDEWSKKTGSKVLAMSLRGDSEPSKHYEAGKILYEITGNTGKCYLMDSSNAALAKVDIVKQVRRAK